MLGVTYFYTFSKNIFFIFVIELSIYDTCDHAHHTNISMICVKI